MMEPIAATVAGPEPVRAAKIAQLNTVTIPSPPGSHPRMLLAQSVSRLEIPPKSIKLPTRINSGTARSVKEFRPKIRRCGTTRMLAPVAAR